ncbi:DNA methylase N-4, partial [Candidatus Pacearchaeota archaeon]|nr:DNA methylase N-4 [Candidatus Pacearchaeota archaeon]
NRMLTLNTDQTQKQKQNHICPLQFDIVDRLIDRYSNKGDIIHDPFGGIMTVPYRAIKKDRRGSAVELNAEYFNDGIPYLKVAELKILAPTLFDLEGI